MAEHDQLFKRTFRVPKHAAGELRAVLPKAVRDAIDFDSLELVQGDVVGQRLNERFNDALFRAKFHGRPGYVWLILEHQSKPDRFMVLRLLDHIVRSWVELVRREPKRKSLPPIACVVVHHGKRGWTAPTSLHDLIEKPAVAGLAHLVPGFHIVVDDLVDQSDEALKARPLGVLPRVVLWALRDARTIRRFFAHLEAWAPDLEDLARTAPEDAASVMRYILSVAGSESFDELTQRLRETAAATETTMTTIAEALVQRGRSEGRAEGRTEGRAEGEARGKTEALLAVLSSRGLPISEDERARIVACRDTAEIDRWLRLAAKVSTSAELFSR